MLSLPILTPLASAGSITFAILGIGFLIFVHELGHYLACRLTKTRVETFSIGFGTRLFGWESRPGEPSRFTIGRRRLDAAEHAMDFRVAVVPLGGYVKMAGENPGEDRSGAEDEFPSKPMLARVFIVSAGVIMNVIAAWALYLVAFASNVELEPPVAGLVSSGGPAWSAGMEAGDRVLALDDERVRSFLELKMASVFLGVDEPVDAVIERDGAEKTLQVVPRYDEEAGAVLLRIRPSAAVRYEQDGTSFAIGPFEKVTVDGIPAVGGIEAAALVTRVHDGSGATEIEVVRENGERITLGWKPEPADEKIYKIGVEPSGRLVLKAVRGEAAHSFQPGDRLLAALRGDERIEIESGSDFESLPWKAPVDRLEVERGTAKVEIPIQGATRAELYASLRDLHIDGVTGLVARPLELGRMARSKDGTLYRYPAVPSEDAGLVAGDRILKVGDRTVTSWREIVDVISEVATPAEISVLVEGLDGEERLLSIRPVALERLEGPDVTFTIHEEPYETEGFGDAMGAAFGRTGREIKNIFRLIGAFFTGRLSFQKNVGGPGTIVKVSSDAAQKDPLRFLLFLAYISVTLAVLNILPIPILDGGHLLFIFIEKIKGSPLKEETMGRLQFIGLMLLLVLMFFAVKNDILFLGK